MGQRLFVAAVILVVVAAAFVLMGGGSNPLTGQLLATLNRGDGSLSWAVGTQKDKLTDQVTLLGSALHYTDDGGKIYLTATCDPTNLSIEFEYHGSDKDKSSFETQGTDELVDISYRLDDNGVLDILSKTNYNNTAKAVFSYEMAADKAHASGGVGGAIASMTASLVTAFLPGLGPQDLRRFLHAREVRFQLPLEGGKTEVIKVYPQEASFGKFLSACKIDVRRFDADLAQDQAAKKAEADKKAADEKAAEDAQQQQAQELQAAEQQRKDAVKQACTIGDGSLRVTGIALLEGAHSGILQVYTQPDQVVQPLADPEAVSANKCRVSFTRNQSTFDGYVPLGALKPVETSTATLSSPDTTSRP